MPDRAIVVGVRLYPEIRDLYGPLNDVEEFCAWLAEPGGGGLAAGQIRKVLSPNPPPVPWNAANARPTADQVEDAFEELDDLAKQNRDAGNGSQIGRRLYLYFSGHGFAPAPNSGALLMANAGPTRMGRHVAGHLWADWFYRAGYFDEIALFMDCCRQTVTTIALQPVTFNDMNAMQGLDRRKRFYAFGSHWGGKSWERQFDDGNYHGIFTTALLKGLRGAAADAEDRVTSVSLKGYLYANMKNFIDPADLANPTVSREPEVQDFTNPNDPMVFATNVATQRVRVRIQVAAELAACPGDLYGSDLSPVAHVDRVGDVWEVRLAKGLYEARVNGQPGKLFRVEPTVEVVDVRIP